MDHYSVRMCKYRENAQHAHLKGPRSISQGSLSFRGGGNQGSEWLSLLANVAQQLMGHCEVHRSA